MGNLVDRQFQIDDDLDFKIPDLRLRFGRVLTP